MTIQEASERYNILLEILREYESWGLCGAAGYGLDSRQYDDTDLERPDYLRYLIRRQQENDRTDQHFSIMETEV